MGSTGIPNYAIPKRGPERTETLNRLAREWIRMEGATIIDESGWTNHGKEKYFLHQLNDGAHPDRETRRFIVTVAIRDFKDELIYRINSEDEGPNQDNCPIRILDKAEEHPPSNQRSEDWRRRVREKHAAGRGGRSIILALRKQYPDGDLRLVLKDGQQVKFGQGRYKGIRRASAYWNPRDGNLHLLKKDKIDVEATLELRKTPADAR